MMELTHDQISLIEDDIRKKGVHMEDLVDDLTDHICCQLESSEEFEFSKAYEIVLASFGPEGLRTIQQRTTLSLMFKRERKMKKTMYILGYLAAFLSSTGLLFKLQHWPGATIILMIGFALLNFGFLPMYFLDKYKSTTA